MQVPVNILVCDDEPLIRWALREHLDGLGHKVYEAENGKQCMERIEEFSPDLLITDLRMPKMGGLEVLRHLREAGNPLPVIVLTAFEAIDSAIEATRLGAHAYLSKPFDLREVEVAMDKALESHRLKNEVRYLKGSAARHYGRIVGESAGMKKIFGLVERLKDLHAPAVLIEGETGTGKDLFARAIHESGCQSEGLYVEIDCAALPESLIESELFGHERGAFTDARSAKPGLFELAKGGTLFLDEIGEMSMKVQSKLLRTLESRCFRRVGGTTDLSTDARIVAATNRNLQEEVEKKNFRQDLYFRLDVIKINVPPLRERRSDIPTLIDHFIATFNREYHRSVEGLSEEALNQLCCYAWPGNVRELRNVIERAIILEAEYTIESKHLPSEIQVGSVDLNQRSGILLGEGGLSLEGVERSLLNQAMERTGGNQVKAAKLLCISRYALRYRLEKHGLLKRKGD